MSVILSYLVLCGSTSHHCISGFLRWEDDNIRYNCNLMYRPGWLVSWVRYESVAWILLDYVNFEYLSDASVVFSRFFLQYHEKQARRVWSIPKVFMCESNNIFCLLAGKVAIRADFVFQSNKNIYAQLRLAARLNNLRK